MKVTRSAALTKPARPERDKVLVMLALTMTTGVVDAVSYVGLDRTFTANMTGNIVFLGLAFDGHSHLPVARPCIAFLGFCVGAVVAGRAHRGSPSGVAWPRQTTALLAVVAAILGLLTLVLAFLSKSDTAAIDSWVTGALGIAMGLQAGTARYLKVLDMPTVVVTSTLTGLAADSTWGAGHSERWVRRALAVFSLALGALLGGLLLQVHIALALGVGALAIVIAGFAAHHVLTEAA